jgi:hypothetical protein
MKALKLLAGSILAIGFLWFAGPSLLSFWDIVFKVLGIIKIAFMFWLVAMAGYVVFKILTAKSDTSRE